MTDTERKNRRVVGALCSVVVCMVGMSYAAVPLYDLFCRVTGSQGQRKSRRAQRNVDLAADEDPFRCDGE